MRGYTYLTKEPFGNAQGISKIERIQRKVSLPVSTKYYILLDIRNKAKPYVLSGGSNCNFYLIFWQFRPPPPPAEFP